MTATAMPSGSVPSLLIILPFVFHLLFSAARPPNQAALNAVRQLIECGVESNKIVVDYQLIGHRQNTASSTDCPGDALYNEVKSWPHWTSEPKSVSQVESAWDMTDPASDGA
jgi:hypothetical protein